MNEMKYFLLKFSTCHFRLQSSQISHRLQLYNRSSSIFVFNPHKLLTVFNSIIGLQASSQSSRFLTILSFQTEGGIPSTFTPSNSSMNTPVKSALNGSQAPPSNPLYRMVVKSEDGRELRAFNFKEEDERQPPQEIEWHRRKLVTKPRMSQHKCQSVLPAKGKKAVDTSLGVDLVILNTTVAGNV
ncbi:hypothetical protein P8452_63948 [Trifolium repens]|nr:hypothetical protein P8452_63948 [Trifolium repens]